MLACGRMDADGAERAPDLRLFIEAASADEKQARADIVAPTIDPAADAWQRGTTVQIPDPRTK